MAKRDTSPELTEAFKKTLEMTKLLDVEVDDEYRATQATRIADVLT